MITDQPLSRDGTNVSSKCPSSRLLLDQSAASRWVGNEPDAVRHTVDGNLSVVDVDVETASRQGNALYLEPVYVRGKDGIDDGSPVRNRRVETQHRAQTKQRRGRRPGLWGA